MTFITPALAIAGVLAVSIPILIHLLSRQRRKPIEWAAMRFLIEAFRKHKRRLRIEQLLLLAVRCLIVGLLGLALARPILEAAGVIPTGGSRAVWLVIDDGMISGVSGEEGGTALQKHVRQAVDLINTLGPGDSVGVITAARPARSLLSPPSTDLSSVANLVQSLTPRESPTDLGAAFEFVRSAVEAAKKDQQQTLVYLFSDFRAGSAAIDSPLPLTQADQTGPVTLLASSPAARQVSNVQIAAIEPVRNVIVPGANDGSGQLTVRLSRSGVTDSADLSTIRLSGEGLPVVEPQSVRWQPGQTTADVKFIVNFSGGAHDRAVSLTASIDDDALNPDNQRHAVLEMRNQIRVLLIDRRSFGFEQTLDQLSAGQWIRRALEPMEKGPVQIVEVEPAALDVADIRTADVAILPRPDLLTDTGWRVLRDFVQRDGLLMIMPPAQINVHQWIERLSKDLQLPWRIALEVAPHDEGLPLAEDQPATELLRLVSSDLSELVRPVLAYRVLPVDQTQTRAQPLLVFADGSPLAMVGSPDANEERDGASVSGSAQSDSGASAQNVERGMVVYLAVAPELSWTNLPSKPLMVPLFHEVVRQGLSAIRASQQLQVGEQPNLARGPAARDIVGPDETRIALDPAGRPHQPLNRAGVYTVHDQSDQPIGKLAVNIDTAAGATDVQSPAAISAWLNASGPWVTFDASNIGSTLAIDRATSPLAGILLLTVLALVVIETLLARWFSHAYVTEIGDQRSEVRFPGAGSSLTFDLRPLTSGSGGES
jgi:hypothetical protein